MACAFGRLCCFYCHFCWKCIFLNFVLGESSFFPYFWNVIYSEWVKNQKSGGFGLGGVEGWGEDADNCNWITIKIKKNKTHYKIN